MVVCLDTMILVWGIQQVCTDGRRDRVPRACALFKQLEGEGARLLIPAPVLAEYLVGVPR